MTKPGKTKRTGYPLRLPPELHKAVAAVAEKERRTFNAQVIYVLERWLESQPGR